MKRINLLLVIFCMFISIGAFASQYMLVPAKGVQAILAINNSKQPIIANGVAVPVRTKFTAPLFAEGIITAVMPTKRGVIKNTCHIIFLNHDKWMAQPFLGDHCQFLQPAVNNYILVQRPRKVVAIIKPSKFAPLNREHIFLVYSDGFLRAYN